MKYVLSPTQIDKILKTFWDQELGGAKVGKINLSGEMWGGLIKKTEDGPLLIIGRPVGREDMMWYSNGHHFNGKWDLFGMTSYDFNKSLGRYVNKNYGLDVGDII
jgi:hypothetical protein